MPWSFWGTHGSGRGLLQRHLSADHQVMLLLELLCTLRDKHYIVHNKEEEVTLHEMFTANTFKISPWISVCQMWPNVRLKSSLRWAKLGWVKPSFVSPGASMEAPEIRLWKSEYPERCCQPVLAVLIFLLKLELCWICICSDQERSLKGGAGSKYLSFFLPLSSNY